ncbi:GNAT family N-acetyltransferase [Arsenophonus nasoniae]|uniref:GNAT family N-acetyltransferase n=1 Tax=Arsenophonus nasoniae TaxID=638 RepID=A0AA95GF27_9GAMM|nr:GNAT family N-acetyltransferase [Arsenophonus nasoniae]WGL95110.1 GNAT family N-acetyltransferase [Arsenophonus nasoniae]
MNNANKIVGENPVLVIKKPGDCKIDELDLFEKMVKKGNQVATNTLRELIENAKELGFIYKDNGICVTVGAIKKPFDTYKDRIQENFKQSGMEENKAKSYSLELGWLYTIEKERRKGHAERLVNSLMKRLSPEDREKVYATIHEDNVAMNEFLPKNGFCSIEKTYKSDREDYNIKYFYSCESAKTES